MEERAPSEQFLSLADTVYEQSDYCHALELYAAFLSSQKRGRLVSDFFRAWLRMGTCHACLGSHEDARLCFAKAVYVARGAFGECSQPHAHALTKLCTSLVALGRVDEARKVGLKAAEIEGTLCVPTNL